MRSIQLFVVLVMLVACLLACVEATATAAGKPQKPQKKGLHKRREAKRAAKHKAKKRAETRAEKRARKAITGKQQGRKLDELDDTTCHDGSAPDGNGDCPCHDGSAPDGNGNCPCNDGGNYKHDWFDDNECDCCDCSDESDTFRQQKTIQCIQFGELCHMGPNYMCDSLWDCDDGSDEDCVHASAANPEDVKAFLGNAITNGQTEAVLQAWSDAGSCN